MITILFVDDNLERIRSIRSVLPKDKVQTEYVTTKNEALKRVAEKNYDLAIIDIMLPNTLDEPYPNKNAGVELINEFQQRRVNPPHHIIGVTSDDETFSEHEHSFADILFPIIKWNQFDNTEWKDRIVRNIEYIYSAKYKNKKDLQVDIAVITAVQDEFDAVLNTFGDWQVIDIPNDPSTYRFTRFTGKDGQAHGILLTILSEMGLTAATNQTTKIINEFSPQKVFMVGICGGVKGKVDLGDLVIASNSWDYGSGKINPSKEKSGHYYEFESSPNQISVNPSYNSLKYSTESEIEAILREWNDHHRDKPMSAKIHCGPMPSGASVICDKALFEEIIKPQHRKCLAIDMETYGVYYACKNSALPGINYLSIKAVSDFADEEKNDDYHEFCCYLSSNYLKNCIYNELL